MKEKTFKKVMEDIILYLYNMNYNEEEKQVQRRILYLLSIIEKQEDFEQLEKILERI